MNKKIIIFNLFFIFLIANKNHCMNSENNQQIPIEDISFSMILPERPNPINNLSQDLNGMDFSIIPSNNNPKFPPINEIPIDESQYPIDNSKNNDTDYSKILNPNIINSEFSNEDEIPMYESTEIDNYFYMPNLSKDFSKIFNNEIDDFPFLAAVLDIENIKELMTIKKNNPGIDLSSSDKNYITDNGDLTFSINPEGNGNTNLSGKIKDILDL